MDDHYTSNGGAESLQRNAPVVIRLTRAQVRRLQRDWKYLHARCEEGADSHVTMTIGEDNQAIVFELLHWLGPGAELVEPKTWRGQLNEELDHMASTCTTPT